MDNWKFALLYRFGVAGLIFIMADSGGAGLEHQRGNDEKDVDLFGNGPLDGLWHG